MAYYANVYELDRRYGGDEEGGWWFTTFTPKESCKFNTKLRARIVLERMLQERLKVKPEYGLYSVNYNGGVFSGHVEDKEAEFSPKGPIHYA
jgi:hypothetical protein